MAQPNDGGMTKMPTMMCIVQIHELKIALMPDKPLK